MCGIAGIFLQTPSLNAAKMEAIAGQMADALIARGPDGRGVWVDAASGVALSHRRLAIIDLSPEGHQPMVSASGRYVISFNGEIYNYRELRAQLDSSWRGQSDTEVLLAAIEAWGIEKTLQKANGMFAFAVWDNREKTLILARDRMGEKPLYYGWVGDDFVFASELKALQTLPNWQPSINRDALPPLMRYSYISAPHSIYERIYKLLPAHYLIIKAGQQEGKQNRYWSFETMVANSMAQPITSSAEEATNQLEATLKFAVGQRMMSDVPLGAFLSGGIDSSSLVALMQAQSSRPIKTFTIGFKEQGFDEAPYAKAVAKHLGTDHTELYVSASQAAAVIPKLSAIYDEPFADVSQIPTYLVSQFARQHVTVALSGDGGDEMFGGYNRYVRGPAIWNVLAAIPIPIRKMAAKLLLSAHTALIHKITPYGTSPIHQFARKLGNYYEKMGIASAQEFYQKICSIHDSPEEIVLGAKASLQASSQKNLTLNYAEWMMVQDALNYFPDDILTKVDRASMAVSLETRTVFTDPDVMAFAWSLPLNMKIRDGKGKWLLRQMLYRYVPKELIERPKAGFNVPIGLWLRGSLKEWAEDLISTTSLRKQGFLNPEAVQEMWRIHQSGQRDLEHRLWNILMFQAWLNKS